MFIQNEYIVGIQCVCVCVCVGFVGVYWIWEMRANICICGCENVVMLGGRDMGHWLRRLLEV